MVEPRIIPREEHPLSRKDIDPDARMILTVHDELLFEVPKTRVDEISVVVRDAMQGAAALNVPLTVDIGVGDNWRDAKE